MESRSDLLQVMVSCAMLRDVVPGYLPTPAGNQATGQRTWFYKCSGSAANFAALQEKRPRIFGAFYVRVADTLQVAVISTLEPAVVLKDAVLGKIAEFVGGPVAFRFLFQIFAPFLAADFRATGTNDRCRQDNGKGDNAEAGNPGHGHSPISIYHNARSGQVFGSIDHHEHSGFLCGNTRPMIGPFVGH